MTASHEDLIKKLFDEIIKGSKIFEQEKTQKEVNNGDN